MKNRALVSVHLIELACYVFIAASITWEGSARGWPWFARAFLWIALFGLLYLAGLSRSRLFPGSDPRGRPPQPIAITVYLIAGYFVISWFGWGSRDIHGLESKLRWALFATTVFAVLIWHWRLLKRELVQHPASCGCPDRPAAPADLA